MRISKQQALTLLQQHNIASPFQLTAIKPGTGNNPEWVEGSNFYSEMGESSDYILEKVLTWLGY